MDTVRVNSHLEDPWLTDWPGLKLLEQNLQATCFFFTVHIISQHLQGKWQQMTQLSWASKSDSFRTQEVPILYHRLFHEFAEVQWCCCWHQCQQNNQTIEGRKPHLEWSECVSEALQLLTKNNWWSWFPDNCIRKTPSHLPGGSASAVGILTVQPAEVPGCNLLQCGTISAACGDHLVSLPVWWIQRCWAFGFSGKKFWNYVSWLVNQEIFAR